MGKTKIVGALLAILFAAVVALYSSRFESLRDHLDVSLVWGILFSQVISLFSCGFLGARLIAICELPFSRWPAGFNTHVASVGLNLILPLRLADVVRPFLLAKFTKLDLAQCFSVVVVERISDIIILGAMATGIASLHYGSVASPYLLVGLVSLSIAAMATLYRWGVPIARGLEKIVDARLNSRIAKFANDCISGLAKAARSRRFPVMFGAAILGWTGSILMVYSLLAIAGSKPVTIAMAAFIFLCTVFGGLVAVLPAAAGTFHAAGFGGLVLVGYSPAEAVVLATGLHIQAFLFPALYSVWSVLSGTWNLGEIRAEIASRRAR